MIRNFLYLDSNKLRSLSSQLFEGVTESILNHESHSSERNDTQKGPMASGQILADIFRERRSTTELRFLEDHAYSIFEQRISEIGMATIGSDSSWDAVSNASFVQIVGPLKINDVKATTDLITNFNKIGIALYRSINHEKLENMSSVKPVSDKEIEKLAKKENMQMDPKFLSSLSEILGWAFKGMIEFQISQADRLFSAPLQRTHLREPEELTIQKYSRTSEGDFTMVGIVTQSAKPKDMSIVELNSDSNLKHALRSMGEHMRAIEDSFSGVDQTEVVIDPIAVYHTL